MFAMNIIHQLNVHSKSNLVLKVEYKCNMCETSLLQVNTDKNLREFHLFNTIKNQPKTHVGTLYIFSLVHSSLQTLC